MSRLAEDRAGQLSEDDVEDEIVKRLRKEANTRGDFAKVHACVPSNDVPDDREARLVILGPQYPNTAKDDNSKARKEAANILECRGTSPRNYRNALVFLGADATRLKELDQAVRQYIAWNSICDEQKTLNLDQFQTKQAETKRTNADETVDARIPETFQWLIVPGQSDPKGNIEWTEIRLQGADRLATRACKKLKNEELLMIELGDVRLRHELDRVPLWRGDHVGIKQLAEDVAKYLYLPRLRDQDVLVEAIREGVAKLTWAETFAYADGWDEQKKRYKGLRAGQSIRVLVDAGSLLVKPDVAAAQIEADEPAKKGGGAAGGNGGGVGEAVNTASRWYRQAGNRARNDGRRRAAACRSPLAQAVLRFGEAGFHAIEPGRRQGSPGNRAALECPGRCGDRNHSGSPLQDPRWRIAGTGADHHGELPHVEV